MLFQVRHTRAAKEFGLKCLLTEEWRAFVNIAATELSARFQNYTVSVFTRWNKRYCFEKRSTVDSIFKTIQYHVQHRSQWRRVHASITTGTESDGKASCKRCLNVVCCKT